MFFCPRNTISQTDWEGRGGGPVPHLGAPGGHPSASEWPDPGKQAALPPSPHGRRIPVIDNLIVTIRLKLSDFNFFLTITVTLICILVFASNMPFTFSE